MSIRFVFLQLFWLFIFLFQERHAYLSIRQCSDFISCLTEMPQTKTLFFLCLVQPCAFGSGTSETCSVEKGHLEALVSTAFIVIVYVLRPEASLILPCFIRPVLKNLQWKVHGRPASYHHGTLCNQDWNALQRNSLCSYSMQSIHSFWISVWNTDLLASDLVLCPKVSESAKSQANYCAIVYTHSLDPKVNNIKCSPTGNNLTLSVLLPLLWAVYF